MVAWSRGWRFGGDENGDAGWSEGERSALQLGAGGWAGGGEHLKEGRPVYKAVDGASYDVQEPEQMDVEKKEGGTLSLPFKHFGLLLRWPSTFRDRCRPNVSNDQKTRHYIFVESIQVKRKERTQGEARKRMRKRYNGEVKT
jgi:hypothetical protein